MTKKSFPSKKKIVIGMIHLLPTMSFDDWPGMDKMLAYAIDDLKALQKGGIDGALIENDGDQPCQVEGRPDVVIPMTIVANELSKWATIPLGIEVLLNDPKASLMIAKSCNLNFIRTDYFVDRMERDGYGEFEIDPKKIMQFREKINAKNVDVYADVQVKYARMLETKKLSVSVDQAIRENASGVIVSGSATGVRPVLEDVLEAKDAACGRVPIIIGSGLSIDNVKDLMFYADWAIVGSSVKTNGVVDEKKVRKLVKEVKNLE